MILDSSDDTTDEEEKVKTPESAPPLEKSPLRTPQAAESLSSRGGTPEMDLEDSHINKNGSEERELEPHEAYEEKSPEIILKEDTLPPYLPALQGWFFYTILGRTSRLNNLFDDFDLFSLFS